MAQRVVVRLIDDPSGAEIPTGKGVRITFDLDGSSYEIDLTANNAVCAKHDSLRDRG
jgi:hypothetical protein